MTNQPTGAGATGGTLDDQIGGALGPTARSASESVGDLLKSAMDGKVGPSLDNVKVLLSQTAQQAGPRTMGTALGESIASLTGSGWGGKIVGGIVGYFLSNTKVMGFLNNTETGRAFEAGIVGLALLKQGNEAAAKLGVPGAATMQKLFDKTPELAVFAGIAVLGYQLMKPAANALGGKMVDALHSGAAVGLPPAATAESPGH